MKKYIDIALSVVIALILAGCDNKNAPDCLKTAGHNREMVLDVPHFSKLEINNEFNVIIKQDPEQKVWLSTGENLINDVDFEVKEDLLSITNHSGCNWVRSYDFPLLTITHPNINFIRQNGGGVIRSEGTLIYPRLSLISEKRSGDFDLNIDCNYFSIVSNDLTNYYISGTTNELRIFFAAGDGRFEGENLMVKKADVKHRGSNEIIIHVTDTLTGNIWSSGDIVMRKSKPAFISIEDNNLGTLKDETH